MTKQQGSYFHAHLGTVMEEDRDGALGSMTASPQHEHLAAD